MGFKLYEVDGYTRPLRLSEEHAEALDAVELDTSAPPPPKSASKAVWAEYAKTQGMDSDAADAATRADLIAQYGG